MDAHQKKCQNKRKFNRFLCEGLCQVPLQERHVVPSHQIIGQPHQIKLQTIRRRLSIDFSLIGNLGHKIQ